MIKIIIINLFVITIISAEIITNLDVLSACKLNMGNSGSELDLVEYDCSSRNLSLLNFNSTSVPFNATKLDFSGNSFEDIPNLRFSHQYLLRLRTLTFAHNKISAVDDQVFSILLSLRTLDLSYNQISVISLDAFSDLRRLESLDLSNNSLKRINYMVFTHLFNLKTLDLSWNQNLYESKEIQNFDFFQILGMSPQLITLKLSYCNFEKLNLATGIGLQYLYLNGNNLKKVPDLPRHIKLLDMSENPIEIINATFLGHLFQLGTLILEDMPKLTAIKEYGFFGLPALKVISLQNSRKLNYFDLHAFGVNVIRNETDLALESLNLSGTSLRTFNSSIFNAFEDLKYLNLEGCPLQCDCELNWIQKLQIDVKGHCYYPEKLRGKSINEFECDWMSPELKHILNSFIILALLVLIIGGLGLIIYGFMRPKRKNIFKVGSSSPYARITTIEPNSAENHL